MKVAAMRTLLLSTQSQWPNLKFSWQHGMPSFLISCLKFSLIKFLIFYYFLKFFFIPILCKQKKKLSDLWTLRRFFHKVQKIWQCYLATFSYRFVLITICIIEQQILLSEAKNCAKLFFSFFYFQDLYIAEKYWIFN